MELHSVTMAAAAAEAAVTLWREKDKQDERDAMCTNAIVFVNMTSEALSLLPFIYLLSQREKRDS